MVSCELEALALKNLTNPIDEPERAGFARSVRDTVRPAVRTSGFPRGRHCWLWGTKESRSVAERHHTGIYTGYWGVWSREFFRAAPLPFIGNIPGREGSGQF